MSLCGVLQVYWNQFGKTESSEKPALCFRGNKWMYAVGIDFPVRVVRRPVADFDLLRHTPHGAGQYPVDKMVAHLRKAGRVNGITAGAHKLLQTVADGRATFPLDEDRLTLTEEDDTMASETTEAQATGAGPTTKESDVAGKKKGKAKAAPKKKAAKAEKPAKAAKAPKAGKKGGAPKKPAGEGIGAFIREQVKAGKSNDDVLAAVKKKFPDSQAKASSVSWHRCQLKKK